jgi:hypothetical protein
MRRRSNMGGAWGALLLAGAAYAWRNRDKLAQQFQSLRGGQRYPDVQRRQPGALPDLSGTEQRDFERDNTQQREWGGTRM